MIRFSVSYNNKVIKTYEIEDQLISIGRLPENKICISNMGISRRHAKIERDTNNNIILSDLNSLNGTFVNNKKVSKTTLSPGDVITIGKYTIVFESDERKEPAGEDSSSSLSTAGPDSPGFGSTGYSRSVQPSFSGEHKDANAAVHAVLIETNKHVVYKIDKAHITIGASENDDVFVSGFMVGEGHIEIMKKENELWISSNKFMGKFKVNGRKKKAHLLSHKDRIEIGTSIFRFMENV
jgi:pSer/pThr/pTyr-binding forkhead associated (FHA) protein